jgi:hypothetical protein
MAKFSIQKMMLDSALKKIGVDSVKLQYIFSSKNVRIIAGDKIATDEIPSALSDMAIKKIASKYPNGKFLSVEVWKNKINGYVLMNDETKTEINFEL